MNERQALIDKWNAESERLYVRADELRKRGNDADAFAAGEVANALGNCAAELEDMNPNA